MTFPPKVTVPDHRAFSPGLQSSSESVNSRCSPCLWAVHCRAPHTRAGSFEACARPHVHAHHEVIGIAVIAQEWGNKKAEDVDDTFFAFGDDCVHGGTAYYSFSAKYSFLTLSVSLSSVLIVSVFPKSRTRFSRS